MRLHDRLLHDRLLHPDEFARLVTVFTLSEDLRRRRTASHRLPPLPGDRRRDPLDPIDRYDRRADLRPVVVAFWQPRAHRWGLAADPRQLARLGHALDMQVTAADGYASTSADLDHLRHACTVCGQRLIITGGDR